MRHLFYALFILPLLGLAKSPVLMSLEKNREREELSPSPAQAPASYLLQLEEEKNGFHGEATFLFWQGSEDGLEFAASNDPRLSPAVGLVTNLSATLLSPDFSWQPGFKVLLGYHFPEVGWDIDARWTWGFFKSSTSATTALTGDGAGLLPLWIPQQAAIGPHPVYGSSHSTFLLHFNAIDLDLALSGAISRALFFKLVGGLKAILIDQKYHVSYTDGTSVGIEGFLAEEGIRMLQSNSHLKNSCSGLGPRVGIGTRWSLPKGLSLLAECYVAMALSSMETKRADESTAFFAGTIQTVSPQMKESFWVWRPLIEAKTGLEWSYPWGKKGFLALEAAYEIQQYWEQNMMLRYADDAIFYAAFNSRGNLILQGLSLSVTVGY